MDNLKKYWTKVVDEWELSVLAVLCITLFGLLCAILLSTGQAPSTSPTRKSMPIQPPRINTDTAYALLDPPEQTELPEMHAFVSGLTAYGQEKEADDAPTVADNPPKEPPKKAEPPQEEPAPGEPPPAPPPENEVPPAPQYHVFEYTGYQRNEDGDKVGIMHNLSEDTSVRLKVGARWHGLMVSELRATEVVFLTPSGRERTLPAHKEIKIKAEQ